MKAENRAFSILIYTILFIWAGLFVGYVSCSAQSNLTAVMPMCEAAPEHAVTRVLNELSLRDQYGEIMYRQGSPVYVSWCRNARFGCEQTVRRYVNIIWNESRAHGISPWVVLAQTYHESRFNAFAESHAGARGILQIHPRSRIAQEVQFVRDRRFREQVCRHRLGHCQGQVIRTSISLLQRSLDRCGDLDKALNMYASGSCDRGYDYSSRVISYYQSLLSNS